MENVIVISPRVISRMKNMSVEERKVMLDTFFCDEVLDVERTVELTPIQELVYRMFRNNVMNESRRFDTAPAQTLAS